MAHQLRNRLRAAWAGLPLRSKGLVVIAIPLGALLVGLVCFFLLGQAEDRQEKWVDHTLRVRSELHLVLIHLVDAETGMRGYLLSRREEFLEPYHAGRKALPESLSRVSDLIQDDPQQIARLRAVKLLVTERLEKLASVMETAAAGSDLPSARTTAGLLEGKAIMDALRQKLARMDQEEGHFMDERVAALDRVRNWSFAAFVASGLFGVLGGVAAMLILSKGVVIRTRALEENTRRLSEEKALRASEAFSRSVIESSPDCIKVLDLEGNLLSMEAGMELLGITDLAPLLGKPWNEFWEGAEDRAAVHAAVATAAAGGEGHFVGFFRTLRGEDKWWDVVISPILDANGKPARLLAVSRDVTQRQQAEEVLRQRTAQFETLLNEAPVGIYLIDADFRVRQVNSAGRPAFGDISDLIGRDFAEVMHILWPQAEADQTIKQFRHALETGEPCFVPEMIAKRADRQTTEYYEWQINRIPLPDGRHGVVCYFRDISERVLAQQKIRESEERYRSLFNSMDEGFCIIEMIFDETQKPVDWRYLEVNPSFETLTGIHDIVGKRIRDLVPDLEAYWFEIYGKVALSGEPVRFVNEAKGLDARWFDLYAFRVGGPDSLKVAVLFTNITERKKAEEEICKLNAELEQRVEERTEALRASEERFRAIADNIPQLVWLADSEGYLGWFNQGWLDYTGTTLEDNQGPGWKAVHHPDYVEAVAEKFARHLREGRDWEDTFPLRGKDGQYRWFLSRMKVIRDETGKVVRFFGTNTDVTERRQNEEALRELNETLEARVSERTEALTVSLHEKEVLLREVHHRVKNNLQIVSSLLNLQSRTLTDPALLQVFASTRDRVRAMAAVHERLYESGDFAQIDLAVHLGKLARTLTLAHAPTGMTVQPVLQLDPVTVDLNTAVPLSLIASELITNALKYGFAGGRRGTLTIGLRAGGGHHELRIGDDGPGFPAALDPATTRTLGLRLVRDLSRQIRGEMEIDSTAAGTNVVVRWPARLAVSEPAAPLAETEPFRI